MPDLGRRLDKLDAAARAAEVSEEFTAYLAEHFPPEVVRKILGGGSEYLARLGLEACRIIADGPPGGRIPWETLTPEECLAIANGEIEPPRLPAPEEEGWWSMTDLDRRLDRLEAQAGEHEPVTFAMHGTDGAPLNDAARLAGPPTGADGFTIRLDAGDEADTGEPLDLGDERPE